MMTWKRNYCFNLFLAPLLETQLHIPSRQARKAYISIVSEKWSSLKSVKEGYKLISLPAYRHKFMFQNMPEKDRR
jgi:hypothetical protein